MLVWDDKTNNQGLHPGLMATHDQETFAYFKDTEVRCELAPRDGGTEDTFLQVCVLRRQTLW
jgi:phospholipase D1/2